MIQSDKQKLLKEYKGKTVLSCSYSQIETFLNCAWKWKHLYIDGMRDDTLSTEALELGGEIHKTFEYLENRTKNGDCIEVGEVLDTWHKTVYEGKIPFESKENQDTAYDQHAETLEGYCNKDSVLAVLISEYDIIGVEEKFFFPFKLGFTVNINGDDYDTVYLNGAIDLVLEDYDGSRVIVDHKSSKKEFDKKKLNKNLQFPIYVLSQLYENKDIPDFRCVYHFTRHNTSQEVEITPERLRETKSELRRIFREMYDTKKYHQRLSPLCNWCDYSKDGTCLRGKRLIAIDYKEQNSKWEW